MERFEKPRFLKKKDGTNPSPIPWTEILSKREDMEECDQKGNSLVQTTKNAKRVSSIIINGIKYRVPSEVAERLSQLEAELKGSKRKDGLSEASEDSLDVIKKFKMKSKEAFQPWVLKNVDALHASGGIVLEEAMAKWERMYPNTPFPVPNAPVEYAKETEEEPAEG